MFCKNLKKISKKSIEKGEQKCNVVTSAEKRRNITHRVTTTVEQCHDITAMSQHWMKSVAKSTLEKAVKLQHVRRNVATLGN